ncbi:MAG: hypothetical protein ACLQQ4_09475 [Bacteroidia bacterium]|jgi:hypothetical protein
MKTKQIVASLVMVSSVIFMYSCTGGSGRGKMLTRKWQIESFKSTDYDKEMATLKQMSDTAKDSMTRMEISNKMSSEQAFMEALKNATIEYKADSTFEMTVSFMGQSQSSKGKWRLSDDEKMIIVSSDNKRDTTIISDINEEKLTANSPDKSVTITYKAVKS